MQDETFVLIAGGGPVGLSAAIELAWRNVPFVLVNDNAETATHPKCNNTNARSMEHFRRLGIASALRAEGLPPDVERSSAYVTRYCGHEFGRLPRPWGQWPTPESPATISQIVLERTLRRFAEARAPGQVHYGCKLVSFESGAEGVTAQLEDAAGGMRSLRARFLIGADGASSTVRRALGIRMLGADGSAPRAFMGGTMLSYYIRAPELTAASGRKPSQMTWIVNPDMRAMMYAQDGGERWVAHYQVPEGTDWRALDGRAVVRAMLGADVEFEIISGGPWTGGLALVAERYQEGPVFLAGDAAHLFTPLGGFGMNTGIGDVMNLGWKLQGAHEGWAGAALLGSYEGERRPMGLRNVQLGIRCTEVMDGWTVPPDFETDTAAGAQARRVLGARAVVEDLPQYRTVGIQLGERYEESPVVWADGTAAPPDEWDSYVPLGRPGARAPHVDMGDGRALYDDLGPGFTLLDFGAPESAAALAVAAAVRHVPLKTLALPPLEPYRAKLVLVRPDQHIAWHGDGVADAGAVIDVARGATSAQSAP